MPESTPCPVCRRTPLVGEQVLIMARDGHESALCELCVANPRSAALGEAVRRERVRSGAGARNVRRIRPQPARLPAPHRIEAPRAAAAR